MTETLGAALVLLILLQIKHMVADFYLQTPIMLRNRGAYLHLGRALHAGEHMIGSALMLAVMGMGWAALLVVALLEWIAHYHIDWGKGRWSDMTGHTPADAGFWRAIGFDQMLHQMTYVAMIWGWAVYG
ncbi:MAG: DUF3307 domain-containing protein [Pseudomonadota bacterium]